MATPIEKALQAAEREFQAEQRYDKAEADYRKAHRNLCLAMAGLDAGKGGPFAQFCADYAVKADAGEVKPRNAQRLRKMRKSGLLDVPQDIVESVDPEKIIVTAALALDPKNALTEEVAVNALSASNGESSDAFAVALDTLVEQLSVLDKDEQVLPKRKKRRVVKEHTTDVDAEAAAMNAEMEDEDQTDAADNAIRATSITDTMAGILQEMDEAIADEHPAVKHLQRAKSSLQKMPPVAAQHDALVLASMEVGALLDGNDTVTDEAIKNLLDAEGSE